jgi:hypothetical protein
VRDSQGDRNQPHCRGTVGKACQDPAKFFPNKSGVPEAPSEQPLPSAPVFWKGKGEQAKPCRNLDSGLLSLASALQQACWVGEGPFSTLCVHRPYSMDRERPCGGSLPPHFLPLPLPWTWATASFQKEVTLPVARAWNSSVQSRPSHWLWILATGPAAQAQ